MRDLSLHILDIVQNSIKANASVITIHMGEKAENKQLVLEIADNGIGMDNDFLTRVEDPFTTSRTTRKIGLGIPLLKESALKCEGKFSIYSEQKIGTKVFAAFLINHIDRLPIGSIGDTMITIISANPNIQFILLLDSIKGEFKLDTEEINKTLKGVNITEFAVLQWLKEYIDEGIQNIFGGVLNEVDG
ncbi:MAG TPA: ATP-binding protein [Ruminiclostridium sp.]